MIFGQESNIELAIYDHVSKICHLANDLWRCHKNLFAFRTHISGLSSEENSHFSSFRNEMVLSLATSYELIAYLIDR